MSLLLNYWRVVNTVIILASISFCSDAFNLSDVLTRTVPITVWEPDANMPPSKALSVPRPAIICLSKKKIHLIFRLFTVVGRANLQRSGLPNSTEPCWRKRKFPRRLHLPPIGQLSPPIPASSRKHAEYLTGKIPGLFNPRPLFRTRQKRKQLRHNAELPTASSARGQRSRIRQICKPFVPIQRQD